MQIKDSIWLKRIFIGVIVFFITIIFGSSNLLEKAELATIDFRFNVSSPTKPDTNIVLVTVDDKSLEFFERNKIGWPWPREFYGVLVDYLSYCKAKAIIFDIDFSSSEIERLEVDAESSRDEFARSMSNAGNVLLITTLLHTEQDFISGQNIEKRNLYDNSVIKSFSREFNYAIAPLQEFQRASFSIGAANLAPDVDGKIRRVPLIYEIYNSLLPHITLSAYSFVNNININKIDSILAEIPHDDETNFFINWYGSTGPGGSFKYYSIHSLIVSGYKLKGDAIPDIPPEKFKDKIVIIGGSAVGLMDYKPTPISTNDPCPGMEIHATILSNLLQKDFITFPPKWLSLLIILFFPLVIPVIFFKVNKVLYSSLMIIILYILYLVITGTLFNHYQIITEIVQPTFAVVLSFISSAVLSYQTEWRKRKELKKLFSRYLSPKIVDELTHEPEKVELGGKEINATVFFSDIQDFTSIAEKCQPKELVSYLNKYFSICTDIILEYDAMLDKYIGDSVMAIFGAPVSKDDHAVTACLAALDIRDRLSLFNAENLMRDMPVFKTRFGLNTGKMIIGNIGTENHLDYTAIGDAVNLASRLEGVNKIFGTGIIISEFTYELAKDHIEARELDFLSVKGKDNPVRIFELICRKGEVNPDMQNALYLFHEGLVFYREKKWEMAIGKFNSALAVNPNDIPSKVYIDKCKSLINEPVSDN